MSIPGNTSPNSRWSPEDLLAFYHVHLTVVASRAYVRQSAEKWWLTVFLHSLATFTVHFLGSFPNYCSYLIFLDHCLQICLDVINVWCQSGMTAMSGRRKAFMLPLIKLTLKVGKNKIMTACQVEDGWITIWNADLTLWNCCKAMPLYCCQRWYHELQ